MASDIGRILKECAPQGSFQPYSYHSKEADALTVHFRPDADYSKRLTDHVTLLLSMESDEIVGCRIKGLSGIVAAIPNFIDIKLGDLRLSLLFLPFYGEADNETRMTLSELAKAAGQLPLKLEDCPAG